jgi:hypothetical protein
MTTFEISQEAPSADPAVLQVAWARIPLLWWRDVEVLVAEPVELTIVDQFTVHAVQRLGMLTAADFHEFTGLPDMVFHGVGRRLHTLGLVSWHHDALHRDTTDPIDLSTVTKTRVETRDFVFLPSTEDLVAVDTGMAQFERAWPSRAQRRVAPLPPHLTGVTRHELLSQRVEQRLVAGLRADVVGVVKPDHDEPLTEMSGAHPDPPVPVCPVLECSAVVHTIDAGPVVTLRSRSSAELVLPDARGIAWYWRHIGEGMGEHGNRGRITALVTGRAGDARLTRDASAWRLYIDGRTAADMAEDRLLVEPIGITVRTEHAQVIQTITLAAADDIAELLIAADRLITMALAAPRRIPELMAEHATLVERVGGVRALARRSWQRGHFWITHRLRESEDFAYA